MALTKKQRDWAKRYNAEERVTRLKEGYPVKDPTTGKIRVTKKQPRTTILIGKKAKNTPKRAAPLKEKLSTAMDREDQSTRLGINRGAKRERGLANYIPNKKPKSKSKKSK